jgi:hypothetical protein
MDNCCATSLELRCCSTLARNPNSESLFICCDPSDLAGSLQAEPGQRGYEHVSRESIVSSFLSFLCCRSDFSRGEMCYKTC